LAYTYSLAADGTKTTNWYDASGNLTSNSVVFASGASEIQSFTAGVLTRDTQAHVDGSRDIYIYNVQNPTYSNEHDIYSAANILTSSVRTHTDGSLAYTYNVAADGTRTTDWYDASGNMTSNSVVYAGGGSDIQSFTAGVLTRDAQTHVDGSRDVYIYNIQSTSYTGEHDVYSAANVLMSSVRTHTDGSLAYTYNLASDGTKTTDWYDTSGNMTSNSVVYANGSSDAQGFTAGVLTRDTQTHVDGSRDIFIYNIQNQTYTSEHDVYSAANVLTSSVRTHADGSLAYTYSLAADGTKTTDWYDASGNLTSETALHADGSKDVYGSNIVGQPYVANHYSYDSSGKLTFVDQTKADGSHTVSVYAAGI